MLPSDQHCASASLLVELSGPLAFCLRYIAQAVVWRDSDSRGRVYVDVSSSVLCAVQSEHIPYMQVRSFLELKDFLLSLELPPETRRAWERFL